MNFNDDRSIQQYINETIVNKLSLMIDKKFDDKVELLVRHEVKLQLEKMLTQMVEVVK
jgi:hypothetical protein